MSKAIPLLEYIEQRHGKGRGNRRAFQKEQGYRDRQTVTNMLARDIYIIDGKKYGYQGKIKT